MFRLGSVSPIDFLPDGDTRAWIAGGLSEHTRRLGTPAARPRLVFDGQPLPQRGGPRDLDGLFELICDVQKEVDQDDVEFTLVEIGDDQPPMPPEFAPLGNPQGQLLHTFHHQGTYALLYLPAVFRLGVVLLGSIARELGRIAIHRAGGHASELEPTDYEADAELAAVALGMGVWVANGAYLFDNACCGGGCGIDLKSLRTGMSLPEACYAVALDGVRRNLPRRAVKRHLASTQVAAFKASWRHCEKEPLAAALTAAVDTRALPESSP